MRWIKDVKRTLGNAIGQRAEAKAEGHLIAHGLTLLERNYHARRGEIDLIMKDGAVLVFIEVRYRKRSDYGSAAESIDYRKQQRIRHTAEHYLHTQIKGPLPPCRFDVVCLDESDNAPQWITDAF